MLYLPAAQSPSHASEARPSELPNLPWGQSVHVVPSSTLYFPAEQSPSHSAVTDAVVMPYLPAGQGVQLPPAKLNFPAGHAEGGRGGVEERTEGGIRMESGVFSSYLVRI